MRQIFTCILLLFFGFYNTGYACDDNQFSYVVVDNNDGTFNIIFNACMEVSSNNGCGGPTEFTISGFGSVGISSISPSNVNFPNGTTWTSTFNGDMASWSGAEITNGSVASPTCISVEITVGGNPAGITFNGVLGHNDNSCGGVCQDNYTLPAAPTFVTNNTCGDFAATSFTDDGGSFGNYSNDQTTIYTICPETLNGPPVTVDFLNVQLNEAFGNCQDFLYVYDGDTPNGNNLIETLCGETSQSPSYTATGMSGCLTFVFYASLTSSFAGWEAMVSCGTPPCMDDIGSTMVMGGTLVGTNEYDLDFGSTITFTQSGYTLPPAAGADPSGIVWAVFNCVPTNLVDPQADPCYIGVDFGDTVSDTNNGIPPSPSVAFSTVWVYPITFDDAVDGGDGTGVDINGDGCIDTGDIYQLNYLPETLCDCADPSCPAGPNVDDSNIQFTDCIDPTAPLTNTTFTTCHTVTTDANGNLGVVQSLGVGGTGDPICIDMTLASRTAELFLANGGQCSGGPIPPTVANGGNSPTFNPEWTGLSPNTDYIICITVAVPDNTCAVASAICVDYYGETVLCGDCNDPCPAWDRETIDGNPTYQECTNINVPFFNGGTNLTHCFEVVADAFGNLGIIQQLQVDPVFVSACSPGIGQNRVVHLYSIGSNCTGEIAPTVANGGGTTGLATFNPEWVGVLIPNATYIACIDYFVPDECALDFVCTDYYGMDCMPPTPPIVMSDSEPCPNSTGNSFSVIAETGTTFTWTVPADATFVGQGTNSITVDFGVFSGDICVTASNVCGPDLVDCYFINLRGVDLTADPFPTTCGNDDGSIDLSAFGPSLNYTYNWSPMNGTLAGNTISGLSSGTYDITVTNGSGCTDVATATVGDSDAPMPSAAFTNASCGNSDGTVTISWTGGTAPYDISGDLTQNGATSPQVFNMLSAGTYNVTVTDMNGCENPATATVGDSDAPMPSAAFTDASCGNSDGTVTISWTGGTAPYDISGDLTQNGATSPQVFNMLSAGTYNVTVTDMNGCENPATATVGDSDAPMPSAAFTDASCGNSDGTVTISWTGGTAPYDISGDLTQNGATSPQVFNMLSAGTYNVTVTDMNGCENPATATVGDSDAPMPSAAFTDASCGNSDGTVTISWTGGTAPYDISGDLTQNGATSPQVFNMLSAGTYNVTVTDMNGCENPATATVGDSDAPMPSAAFTDASCGNSDGTVTISWTGGTAPYDISGDLTQNGATSPQVFNMLSAGTYNVTVTDMNGCENPATATVGDSDAPMPSAAFTDASCGNSDGTVTISWTGGTAPYDISGDLTQNGATSPQVFNMLSAGTYNVTVTDMNGCENPATATVGDSDAPMPSAAFTDASCGNSDGTVTISWTGGTAPYDISGDLTQNGATSPQVFNMLSAGTYNVTVTDMNGCENPATATVGDSDAPMPSAAFTDASCGNSDGTVTISWTGGTAPYDISGDLTQNGATSPQVFNMLSAGTYNVTVTDMNGCENPATATVGDSDAPMPSAAFTDASCGNSDGTVTISWTGGTAPYDISGDLTQNGATSPQVFNMLSAGTYNVTVTDMNGCENPATATVGDSDAPMPSAAFTDASCGNSDGTVTISWTGGTAPYDISGDLTQNGATSPQVFNMLSAGTYNVTVTDMNGCENPATATVGDSSVPTVSAIPIDASCAGIDNGSITASGNGGTPNYTYSIDGISFQTSGTFNMLAPGNYTITVQDANNCANTTMVNIGVGAGPTVNANGTDESCPGENDGTISANGNGGTPNYMYSIDGVNFQISGAFTNVGEGSYTVTIQDANGCINTNTVDIGVGAAPSITNITPVNPSDCGVDDGSITVTATGTNLEYSIDGGANWQTSNIFNGLSAGSYTVLVRVIGSNNCTDMDMVNLTAPSAPSLMVDSTDPTDCGVNDGTITITGMGTNLEYSIDGINWFPNGFFDNLAAGNYALMVREVDAPTCTVSGNANLTAPTPPTIDNLNGTDPTDCGQDDGTITVFATGINLEYSLDNIVWQTSNVFTNLPAGNYTIFIREIAAPDCTDSGNTTLTAPLAPIITNLTPTNPSDCGTDDGTITVTATGTNLEYSLDGIIWQTGNVFSNLSAGNYTVFVREIAAPDCMDSENTTLTAPMSPMITDVGTANPSDCGVNDGTITITANGINLEYSIDGGTTWQVSNQFMGLSSGDFTVLVREIGTVNCTDMEVVSLTAPSAPMITDVDIADATDCGTMDGSITITATGTNLEYSIDGINFQTSNIFNGLPGGIYTITVREIASPDCFTTNNANILAPVAPTILMVTPTNPTDCGVNNGTITIVANGVNLEYSIDGGIIFQPSNQFTNLPAGNFDIVIQEVGTAGCTDTDMVSLTAPSAPVIIDILTTNPTNCGVDDGTITIVANGVNLEYSINGIDWFSSNIFTDLAGGNYTPMAREVTSPDCVVSDNAEIIAPGAPVITDVVTIDPTGCGTDDGTITITAMGNNLEYSIDGGATFQASNVFDNLPTGNYDIVVQEVGTVACTDMDNAILTAPVAPMILNVATTDPTDCNTDDGTITITAMGNNLEYSIDGGLTFQTSNLFDNLPPNMYDIVIQIIGTVNCTDSDTATLTGLTAPTITDVVSTNPSDCGIDDGTITITATGTNLEYSIDGGANWQVTNVFNGLSAGNYVVLVREIGTMNCTDMDNVTLSTPNAPMITAVNSTDPTDCGMDDGTITIEADGVLLEYSIDGGITWQTSNIFDMLPAGNYNIVVREQASPTCTVSDNAMLTTPETPVITDVMATNPSDCGMDDGTITVTATGANLEYSIDNGATWQVSNVFNDLPAGMVTVLVRNANSINCTALDNAEIIAPGAPVITDVVTIDPTGCGTDDGTITITAMGNNLEYSIDGGATFQASNVFDNLPTGNYDIVVQEVGTVACTDMDNAILTAPVAPMILNVATTDPTDCNTDDGTITITAMGNNLEYSIDGGLTFQTSNLFDNLPPNMYDIVIQIIGTVNCTDSDTATLTGLTAPTITDVVSTNPSDCGIDDGTITITATGTNLEYSIDGGANWQVTNVFNGLSAGNYVVLVREIGTTNCTDMDNVTLSTPNAPMITAVNSTDPTDCGMDDGTITIEADGVLLEYSIDGGITWQTSNIFDMLPAGNYNIVVREQASPTCTVSDNAMLTTPETPVITDVMATNPSDCGMDDGTITVTATGANLEYSIDNGATWQVSNVFNDLPAGMVTVLVRNANSINCTALDNAEIIAPGAPVITDVVTIDPTGCGTDDGTITITAMGNNLEYSIDGGATFQASNVFDNLPTGNYDIVVQEVGTVACTDMDNAILTAPVAPMILNVATTDPTDCNTDDGTITITAMGNNLEYSIDGGLTFQTSNLFDNLPPNMYDIVIQIIGTVNCTDSDTATLTGLTAPTITDVVSTNPSDCGIDDGTITITATGTNLEYSIDGGANWQVTNVFNGLSAGNYVVLVREIGTTNCTDMDNVTLSTPNAPMITAVNSTDPTDCGMDDGTITIEADGVLLEYSIDGGMTWQTSNIFDMLPAGNYNIVVREQASPTCTVSDNAMLTTPETPVITDVMATNPSDCGMDDGTITVTATGANLEYSIDNGATWQVSNVFNDLPAGMVTVLVRNANSINCTALDNAEIIAPGAPVITDVVTIDPTGCGTDDGTITITAMGNNLEYSIDGGATFQASNVFDNLPTGNYDIVVQVANSANCNDAGMTTLTEIDSPTIENIIENCSADNTTYTVTFEVAGGDAANFQFGGNTGTFIGSTFTSDPIPSGDAYNFILNYGLNCPTVEIDGVVICDCPPITATISILSDFNGVNVSCAGGADGSASVTNINGGINPYTYEWSNGENAITATSLVEGWQYVTITDSNGCAVVDSVELSAPTTLTLTPVTQSNSCLVGGSVDLDNVLGGTTPYLYSFNNNAFGTETNFNNLSSGTYDVVIQDANGCEVADQIFIEAATELVLELGDDELINLGESVVLNPQFNSVSIDTFIWVTVDSLDCFDCENPVATPTDATTYQLTIIDEDGCEATDIQVIFVAKNVEVHVPNIFSPNNDGTNEFVTVYAGNGVESIKTFMIFDRWGESMWVGEDFAPNIEALGWDGNYRGKSMNPGVYVWFAEVVMSNGTVELFKGDVTLVR